MDNEWKNYPDTERPTKKKTFQQLLTYNMIIYDVNSSKSSWL